MKRPWRSLWLTTLLLLLLSCQAAILKGPGETVLLGREDLSGVAGADLEAKIARDLLTLRNVIQGLTELEQRMGETIAALGRREAGSYTQAEDNRIRALLQSYLNYRSVLLRLLGYYSSFETVPREDLSLKAFLLAYGSGLMLFREGILLVTTFRDRPPARAKLNEPEPVWGIPPGIFEMVYSNITSPMNVRLLGEAWEHYSARLPRMVHYGLTGGPEFAWLHEVVRAQQRFIEEKSVSIWAGKWDIMWRKVHALGRRPTYNAVALMGTFTSQVKIWISQPLITPAQVQALKRILQPGDIILERRNWYLSNGFLPGFWPHMALYVGAPEDLEGRGLLTHSFVQRHLEHFRQPDRNGHERRVIEVVASGVMFSSLEEMAAADHLAILRPRVSEARKNAAIIRAFSHYGKPYDFDFDFFSTDRLVCTELVYRAYDETLEGEHVGLPLVRILGRGHAATRRGRSDVRARARPGQTGGGGRPAAEAPTGLRTLPGRGPLVRAGPLRGGGGLHPVRRAPAAGARRGETRRRTAGIVRRPGPRGAWKLHRDVKARRYCAVCWGRGSAGKRRGKPCEK